MKQPDYFVINNSDGDTYVTLISESELCKRLDENYWGDVEILTDIPLSADTNYWGESILIIRGNIAVPSAAEVVTKHVFK